MRKTKIICTLGPSTDDRDILKNMMLAGMNVARINMSHQKHSIHKTRVDMVKELREELNLPVALMLDTKGPEIRLGSFEKGSVFLKEGCKFTLTTDDIIGDDNTVSVTFKKLPNEVNANDKILIDDGLIELKVLSKDEENIYCEVLNGGRVSAHKSVNIPGVSLSLPFISDADKADLRFAVENDFDFIAASFTRTREDIQNLRDYLESLSCKNIRIISKIENGQGVKNIDDIIDISDGIMVARGDLGVEVPLQTIPTIQKRIIGRACNAGKDVITATQMLESMVNNPRPTRAEATDVANAVYDGTSAVMLSAETAAGLHPLEALKTMSSIAEYTEQEIDYKRRFELIHQGQKTDLTSAISHATVTTAHDMDAKAIFTVTESGRTSRAVSRYRPSCPIISGTPDKKAWYQLSISWGITPIIMHEKDNTDELFDQAIDIAKSHSLVSDGDLCVITAGIPLGISGTTNLLKAQVVGETCHRNKE